MFQPVKLILVKKRVFQNFLIKTKNTKQKIPVYNHIQSIIKKQTTIIVLGAGIYVGDLLVVTSDSPITFS